MILLRDPGSLFGWGEAIRGTWEYRGRQPGLFGTGATKTQCEQHILLIHISTPLSVVCVSPTMAAVPRKDPHLHNSREVITFDSLIGPSRHPRPRRGHT